MEILVLLLPLAVSVGAVFLGAYFWAVKTGQFDDMTTPAHRILLDDEPKENKRRVNDMTPEEVKTKEETKK